MSDLSQALETAKATPKQLAAFDLLARSKPELAKLLPVGVTVERFERVVRTTARLNPLLLECDAQSFLGAVMHTAQLGLEPGPLGLVYLVPFKREVTLIVGYRGYIELAYRSGLVKDVQAELVHDGDGFRVVKGTSPKIEHVPDGPPDDRDVIAAYAVARLKTGGTVSTVLYEDDWERARKASVLGAKNVGPWVARAAMIRKTALRRLEPWIPKTPAWGVAMEVDEQPAERLDVQVAGEVVEPVASRKAGDDG